MITYGSNGVTFLCLIGGYLIGSIPSGYLLGRWVGIYDIRHYGSGNIGATNVARQLGLKYFFIVLFLDGLKAYAYLFLCMALGVSMQDRMFCSYMLLVGNSYSLFLWGTGGKGVATLLGILLALYPSFFIAVVGTWAAVLVCVRNVGMASVISVIMAPWYALVISDTYGFIFLASMACWIVWRHRTNIRVYTMVR